VSRARRYCPVEGCCVPIPAGYVMCTACWRTVDRGLRDAIVRECERLRAAMECRLSQLEPLRIMQSRAVAEVEDKRAGLRA
jgi:hypothetical protein